MSQKIAKAAKAAKADKIVQAWKIINAFSLNDDILIAGHAEKRFCMITEAGRRTTHPPRRSSTARPDAPSCRRTTRSGSRRLSSASRSVWNGTRRRMRGRRLRDMQDLPNAGKGRARHRRCLVRWRRLQSAFSPLSSKEPSERNAKTQGRIFDLLFCFTDLSFDESRWFITDTFESMSHSSPE